MPDSDEEQTSRTFKIEYPHRKRFEVQTPTLRPDTSTPHRRKFTIEDDQVLTRLPNSNREILFARQKNAYDCGPCLVLNTLQALNIESGLTTISDVRTYANQLRVASNESLRVRSPQHALTEPQLSPEGWFTNGDMDEVLRGQGLVVRSWPLLSDNEQGAVQAYADELAQKGQEFVVYSGNGRHYRGIYKDKNSYYLLDSLNPDINLVDAKSIPTMIRSAGISDRTEFISIATQASPTQRSI